MHTARGTTRHDPRLFEAFPTLEMYLRLQLASHVSGTGSEPLLTIQLDKILSWERGGKLRKISSPSLLSFLRISIDSGGISEVERLSHRPPYSAEFSHRSAFIVDDQVDISGVTALFVDGAMRLQLTPQRQALPIWNTRCPPDLPSCGGRPRDLSSWQRFHAVETDSIRGLTFFLSCVTGELFGIYIHHTEESCAASMYERFWKRNRRAYVWIFLPIPKGDRILALGVRQEPSSRGQDILVRTRLAGDVTVGGDTAREAPLQIDVWPEVHL